MNNLRFTTEEKIRDKEVYIFENHNMALPVWGAYACGNNSTYNLVSFDSHADTKDPFVKAVSKMFSVVDATAFRKFEHEVVKKLHLSSADFSFDDLLNFSDKYVANDEHIFTAIHFGYINEYHLFCHVDGDISVYQEDDQKRGLQAFYHERSDIMQMSEEYIKSIITAPFILDFDLDYFIDPFLLSNKFRESVKPLVDRATVITIAREHCYFNRCVLDDNLTNDIVLEKLLSIIEG